MPSFLNQNRIVTLKMVMMQKRSIRQGSILFLFLLLLVASTPSVAATVDAKGSSYSLGFSSDATTFSDPSSETFGKELQALPEFPLLAFAGISILSLLVFLIVRQHKP